MFRLHPRRLLLWVVLPAALLVLLYAGLGFLAVPRLLRSGVQDFVSGHYHRSAALGEIRFNPFTLRLDVSDFALPDADGQPMLAFRHLMVDLTVASIWRRGPDFESILLQQPFARVLIKPDGTLNLSDLALPPAPGAKPAPSAGPARLFINHFSVQQGNVAFEDQAHPSAFRTEIKPISFDLRNFSTVGSRGGTYALNGISEAGERFSWSGSLSANPLASNGQFEVNNLQARTVWNYVRDSVHFELPTGLISVQGDYNFTAATAPVGLAVDVHDVTVTDLGVRPKGAAEDYVKLDRLEVRETRADVTKRSVTVGSVRLAGGAIRAWVQPPGAVNLLELSGPAEPSPATSSSPATPPAAATSPAAATPSATVPTSAAWTVSVPDISVEGLKISAEDRQVTPAVTVRLDGFSAHVSGFSMPRAGILSVTLSTRVNEQGKLDLKADVEPDSSLKVRSELDRLDLVALQPYIAQRTSMTLRSGLLSSRLNVERGADGELSATGDVELARLRTVDNALKRDFIKFERLQVSGIDFKSKPASLRVHSIVAREPYARVIVEADRTVNVARVLREKSADQPSGAEKSSASPESSAASNSAQATSSAVAPDSAQATATAATATPSGTAAPAPAPPAAPPSDAAAAEATAPAGRGSHRHRHGKPAPAAAPGGEAQMAIAIDAVRIENGSANYSDFWIQPNFAVGIQGLGGSILGLSSDPRARAKVELQGKVDRYAPVHIWGEINPLAATAYSDIKMSFKGVELTSVTPYSGHFAGYKIEKGKLSVNIAYKIENRQLTAEHRFVIDQLELGDRVESPDAVKLPLKIAIALLKDRNGVIDVNLPVTGSLDNPQFKLGPLIWKAVLGLLTKIATAPFAALGHLFGGGEQMNYIDFNPGSAQLDPPERDKLSALVKALKEKTQLKLDVPVTFSADLDRPGLAAAGLNRRLLALTQQGGAHGHGRNAKKPGPEASPAAEGNTATTGTSTGAATDAGGGAGAGMTEAVAGADPLLSDPGSRFHLLVALYHAELGKDSPLPDSAQAIVAAEKKKAPPPDFGGADSELEAALLPRMTVSDADLEALGKRRAQAIQDALLGGGEIDPSRVFVIGNAPKTTAAKDKVRAELALK